MGHDRTTRRRDVTSGRSDLARAIAQAFVPARAKRDITDTALRGRGRRVEEPAEEATAEAGTTRRRGPTKAQRRLSVLGESGRARARIGAVPHGKKGTHAKRNAGKTKVGQKAKAVRGSPKAKRRVANRTRRA